VSWAQQAREARERVQARTYARWLAAGPRCVICRQPLGDVHVAMNGPVAGSIVGWCYEHMDRAPAVR
jgi:hypothetical protein